MTWVRSDDREAVHPKMLNVGIAAFGFYQAAKQWASRNLTDGFVPTEALGPAIYHGVTRAQAMRFAAELAEARDPARPDSAPLFERREGGWQIHDYLDYNPSRDEVLAERRQRHEAKARAGRLGGLASGASRRAQGEAQNEADAKQTGSNGQAQGVAERSPVPVPVPVVASFEATPPCDPPHGGGATVGNPNDPGGRRTGSRAPVRDQALLQWVQVLARVRGRPHELDRAAEQAIALMGGWRELEWLNNRDVTPTDRAVSRKHFLQAYRAAARRLADAPDPVVPAQG